MQFTIDRHGKRPHIVHAETHLDAAIIEARERHRKSSSEDILARGYDLGRNNNGYYGALLRCLDGRWLAVGERFHVYEE